MNTVQSQFDTFSIEIETISPLHIGGDSVLSSVGEFITTTNKIRYLNTKEISNYLDENKLLDTYSDEIIQSAEGFDTLKALESLGLKIDNYITKELDFAPNSINVLHNNVLQIFIEAKEHKYIPGSSVKGMIKTALIYHYLKQNKHILKKIEDEMLDIDIVKKDFNYKLIQIWEKYERQIFEIKEFNFLRFTDSEHIKNEYLQVEQLKRQHIQSVDTEGLDWLAETVRPNTLIPLRMQILPQFSDNQSVLNSRNITDIFSLVNDYSLTMIDFEIILLNSSSYAGKKDLISKLVAIRDEITQSQNDYAICRLGKGKTVYFNTILALLSSKIQKRLIEKLFKTEEGSTLFPATRVLTVNEEMLGWIRIRETEPRFNLTIEKGENKENLEHPALEIIPPQNHITELINQETELNVTVNSQKTVTFILNQDIYENVQLVNPFKKPLRIGEVISVIVWQINKIGKINQVKFE